MAQYENQGSVSNQAHVQHIHGNAYFAPNSSNPPGSSIDGPNHATQVVSPSIVIPFRRDRDFVERAIFDEIWQCASSPGARVAAVGLGGVGKTQLAIEYAYRRREADPQSWVFWVHASSAARIEQSYRQIARQVGIENWFDPKTDILQLIHSWLLDECHGRWTLIVDNADSIEVAFGLRTDPLQISNSTANASSLKPDSHEQGFRDYLPVATHGSILITSRSREVAVGLIEYPDDIFEVGPMREKDGEAAVTLLSRRLTRSQRNTSQEDLARLARELDYMPLAISQAAAYINQLAPRMTVARYLTRLEADKTEQQQLLQQNFRDPRRDGQASNSIIITWQTSFDHIRQFRSSAARLLSLMCLFDRQGIPATLLPGEYPATQAAHISGTVNKSNFQGTLEQSVFEDDLSVLMAYCLIGAGIDGSLLEMHRLVQLSTRAWLELHGELAYWQSRYIDLLGKAFPTGEHKTWPTCQALFPHVEALISYNMVSDDLLLLRAAILSRGASYARSAGQYTTASYSARVSLADRERLMGLRSRETLDSMLLLGSVLRYQGKYEEAEALLQKAIPVNQDLGDSPSATVELVNSLALTLWSQRKYEQAEQMCRQALAASEQHSSVDRRSILAIMNNLALALRDQGKYEQAEEMFRRVVVQLEKQPGSDLLYPMSMDNLATVLSFQGKHEEAEQMCQRSLARHEQLLGSDHPETISNIHNLASVFHAAKKYEQAELMYRRALVAYKRQIGDNHPWTLICLNNLATVLRDQGKYEEAEQMYQQLLAECEQWLRAGSCSTTVEVSAWLADRLCNREDYDRALQLYNHVIQAFVNVLGPSHPSTLVCQEKRQKILQQMNKTSPIVG